MLNDQYQPASEHEEDILDVLRDQGRMRPTHIAGILGVDRGMLGHYLKRLLAAGWISQPRGPDGETLDGQYEFVADPRDMSVEERCQLYEEYIAELSGEE